jgi:hypothetical protein
MAQKEYKLSEKVGKLVFVDLNDDGNVRPAIITQVNSDLSVNLFVFPDGATPNVDSMVSSYNSDKFVDPSYTTDPTTDPAYNTNPAPGYNQAPDYNPAPVTNPDYNSPTIPNPNYNPAYVNPAPTATNPTYKPAPVVNPGYNQDPVTNPAPVTNPDLYHTLG